MRINSKAEFMSLSEKGMLGNRLQMWDNVNDLAESKFNGYVALRSRNKADARHTIDFISVKELYRRTLVLPPSIYFQETPPPQTIRTINIEAWLGPRYKGDSEGVSLYYEEFTTKPVRGLRERGALVHRLLGSALLRYCISADSHDMLMDIWNRYPTSIIEATEFPMPVGVLHQNMVIWEVRDY